MRRKSGVLFVCLNALGIVYAQASFEVASIKLHPEPITMSADPAVHGSMVTATASTLVDVIEVAYDVRGDQIVGASGWVQSSHWDIAAKAQAEGTITKAQLRQMLQTLLADRFQLKIHRETKEVPVFALVVGKNGPKFQASSPDATGGYTVRGTSTGMHMEAKKGTMEQLTRQLVFSAGRPVLDRTGLPGYYAFTLDWISENATPPPDSNVPAIFTAVQEQLGLKLEPTKGPIEMLVIDHVEKPSGN